MYEVLAKEGDSKRVSNPTPTIEGPPRAMAGHPNLQMKDIMRAVHIRYSCIHVLLSISTRTFHNVLQIITWPSGDVTEKERKKDRSYFREEREGALVGQRAASRAKLRLVGSAKGQQPHDAITRRESTLDLSFSIFFHK